jgi:hypothetical protein
MPMSLGAPLWLLGLLLLPVIRWLHRGGRHRRALPVSHLGLWQGAAVALAGAGRSQPPDPAWRRRALLAALISIALAGPQLPDHRVAVTLWIDDSISMLTREPQGTRLAEGLARARKMLAELADADVELRTLGDPWRSLGGPTEAVGAALAASAGAREPEPPPAALLRGDRLHWLLTDGADAALLDWPDGRQADRVIQVGAVTRNVGLARASARRSLDDPRKDELQLRITNGGTAAEKRVLVITTEAGEVARSVHEIDPGASVLVPASIPASARVRATLQPGDALPEDDEIALDLAPLRRRRVATDPHCPAALVAAVASHPALAAVPERAEDVVARLDCSARGPALDIPALRVLADGASKLASGPMLWSPSVAAAQRVRLEAGPLGLAARLAARAGDAVLLAAGDEPVVVRRAAPAKLIETSLDFTSPGIARGPLIPLLVNLMFEQLLGGRLLDAIALADRGAAASRVAPSEPVREGAGRPLPSGPAARRDGTRPLLALALLVLMWEIVALGRQWFRLREHAGAASG